MKKVNEKAKRHSFNFTVNKKENATNKENVEIEKNFEVNAGCLISGILSIALLIYALYVLVTL